MSLQAAEKSQSSTSSSPNQVPDSQLCGTAVGSVGSDPNPITEDTHSAPAAPVAHSSSKNPSEALQKFLSSHGYAEYLFLLVENGCTRMCELRVLQASGLWSSGLPLVAPHFIAEECKKVTQGVTRREVGCQWLASVLSCTQEEIVCSPN